jgi:hypothetical protein
MVLRKCTIPGLENSQWGNRLQDIQDGDSTEGTEISDHRICCQDRSSEWLPTCTDTSTVKKVHGIHVEKSEVLLQCPSIWTEHCSEVVHEDHQGYAGALEKDSQHHNLRIHRRSIDHWNRDRSTQSSNNCHERPGNHQLLNQSILGQFGLC